MTSLRPIANILPGPQNIKIVAECVAISQNILEPSMPHREDARPPHRSQNIRRIFGNSARLLFRFYMVDPVCGFPNGGLQGPAVVLLRILLFLKPRLGSSGSRVGLGWRCVGVPIGNPTRPTCGERSSPFF